MSSPPATSILDRPISPALRSRVSAAFGRAHRLVPVEETGDRLVVAAAAPADRAERARLDTARGNLEKVLRKRVEIVEADEGEIAVVQDRLWGRAMEGPRPSSGASDDDEPAVVRLLDEILTRAVADGASDVHIEPAENDVAILLRIDGRLVELDRIDASLRRRVPGRLKALAELANYDPRVAQDGQFVHETNGIRVDVRVSILPNIWGQRVVLRLLDRSAVPLELGSLGFSGGLLAEWRAIEDAPNGLVLVTGPTGSGKSTTLAATLVELKRKYPYLNIMTVEDPVEYRLTGISQTQVNPAVGLDFATVLRHVLRQDPDIILVGEIRDRETADLAVRAALTGHLVLSTLHTNDAASAPARLLDMGIESFLLADTLRAVLAQRLVRVNCPLCRAPAPHPDAEARTAAEWLGLAPDEPVVRGRGCPACHMTGFRGRTGIYELLRVNQDVRNAVWARANVEAIASAAGYAPMRTDGVAKIRSGATTPEEVRRAVWTG